MADLIKPSKNLLIDTANTHKFKDFKNPKICVYCGSSFNHGRSDSTSCGLCYIEYKCLSCNKIVSKKFRDFSGKMRKEMIFMIKEDRLKEYSGYCSYTCSSKSRMSPGLCSSCGQHSDKRSISFLCGSCQKKASDKGRKTNTSPGNCAMCGKHFDKRMINGYCQSCHSKNIKEISNKNSEKGKCVRCFTLSDKRSAMGLCFSCHSGDTIKNNNKRSEPGNCAICKKHSDKRNIFGKCPSCVENMLVKKNEKFISPGVCTSCNKYSNENRDMTGSCKNCSDKVRKNIIENLKGPGICSKCKKHKNNRVFAGICLSCYKDLTIKKAKENMTPGLCSMCGIHSKENRSIAGLCSSCRSKIMVKRAKKNMKPGLCSKCGKFFNKRNIFGTCYKCIQTGNNFDREAFYKEKFKLISFDSLDQDISWSNIDSLKDIPGVWSVWSSNNECLDVCQTINIGKEMLAWIRSYKACKGKSDEELIEMNIKHRRYNRKKKRDIAKHCSELNSNPIFKVVSINIETKEQREAIESQYAHNNKSIFWSPGLGQKITKGFHSKPATFSNKSTT